MNQLNRRQFLKVSACISVASGFYSQVANALTQADTLTYFSHGVASGDPQQHSVVLWTRVTTQQTQANVSWRIALDVDFKQVVQRGSVSTSQAQDYCAKVWVQDLMLGQTYYYQFEFAGVKSEPGRCRTLPDGKLAQLCLAAVSCSNYPFGYFNVYDAIAKDNDIDFVVHLGDYIYEYGPDGFGGEQGKTLDREHVPAKETISLADYRQRHAQYKLDTGSRLLHAMHTMVTTWDDHESANNPYIAGAQNHTQASEGDWQQRKQVSVQAYYEWMPIREPSAGLNRDQFWRSYRFGNLATMVTLETRHTARVKQIDYADHLKGIDTADKRAQFVEQVLWADNRPMLSDAMLDFYQVQMKTSKHQQQSWQLVANPIPIAKTHVPNLDSLIDQLDLTANKAIVAELVHLQKLGKLDLPLYLDTWDGYPKAREDFYQLNRQLGIDDLLVLTGDSHSFWFNQLFTESGDAMGHEFGTAGVTSPGDFEAFGQINARKMDTLLAKHNKEINWTDGLHRGFVKVSLTADNATVQYMTVSNIKTEQYQLSELKRVEIEKPVS